MADARCVTQAQILILLTQQIQASLLFVYRFLFPYFQITGRWDGIKAAWYQRRCEEKTVNKWEIAILNMQRPTFQIYYLISKVAYW